MQKEECGSTVGAIRLTTGLLLLLVFAVGFLATCGNDEEVAAPLPEEQSETFKAAPSAGAQPDSLTSLLPCHTDFAAMRDSAPTEESDPEVIRVELVERPYRMIPSDIVLTQNRWYEFAVTAGEEWHSFLVEGIGTRIEYEIPPGSEKKFLVHTTNAGTFKVKNRRRIRESELPFTITVVPEGMRVSTWNNSCALLSIQAPPHGTPLSAPFVLFGTVKNPSVIEIGITRIEAWSNGEQVGSTTREQFIPRDSYNDFLLPIINLDPGSHSLLLIVYLQNNSIAATATVPVTIQPQISHRSLLPGYLGSIDQPEEANLFGLPVTIQGWVVIPGSQEGTGVGSVEVWNGPRETGQFLTEAVYGLYRPDVAEDLDHAPFASSGFYAQVSNLPPGQVDLHVYVRDRETGEYVSPRFRHPPLTRQILMAEGKVSDAAWPVALAAAPDGRLFYAELLTGNIRVLQDGQVLPQPFATLQDVSNHSESGLLGLTLHPNFAQEPFVYAMYVVDDPETGLPSGQRVVRFRDEGNVGRDYTVILDNLPATKSVFHNGGRLTWGPDGKLYLSIGDTDLPELAQDPSTLEGSVLRYNPDGSVPADNPFPGSPVYAYGLRNVFGLAIQPETGFLFATDNGPGGFDEVNRIEAGHDYGWPSHMGVQNAEGVTDPIAVFGIWPEFPIGPTGIAFSLDRPDILLFCAYHGFLLRGLHLSGAEQTFVEDAMVLSQNCALDVTYSSDGWLYYSTNSAIYRARLDDLLRLYEMNAEPN